MKVFDVLMESLLEAENEAFKAMGEVKTGYKFSQASAIYDKIKKFRMELEDELYPSQPDPIISDFEIERVKGNPPCHPDRSPSDNVEAYRLTRGDGISVRFIREQE